MSQVSEALFRLGEVARRGYQDVGRREFQGAQLGLQRAKQSYDIGRQQTADAQRNEIFEQGRPGRENQFAADELINKRRKEPVTIAGMAPTNHAMQFFLLGGSSGKGGRLTNYGEEGDEGGKQDAGIPKELPFYTGIQQITKAHFDTKEGSPTRGHLISNKTGKSLTWGDMEEKAGEIEAYTMANMGVGHIMRTVKNKLDSTFQNGEIDRKQYREGMVQYNKMNTTEKKIELLNKQLEFLIPFKQTWAKNAIKRIRTSIGKEEGKISASAAKASEQAFKRSERVAGERFKTVQASKKALKDVLIAKIKANASGKLKKSDILKVRLAGAKAWDDELQKPENITKKQFIDNYVKDVLTGFDVETGGAEEDITTQINTLGKAARDSGITDLVAIRKYIKDRMSRQPSQEPSAKVVATKPPSTIKSLASGLIRKKDITPEKAVQEALATDLGLSVKNAERAMAFVADLLGFTINEFVAKPYDEIKRRLTENSKKINEVLGR